MRIDADESKGIIENLKILKILKFRAEKMKSYFLDINNLP